ncbi:four helix bundle protein [Cyclobacterium lianum]|uniref:Four helix bundle protein n=1 Tax=Cyclobacterium lianum TaxID=388280 RepID=A0A1M7NU04_9BACT|nr:four helix bundle protein [Cyclobacterium lianum]SHN07039.1 four helix bundle protein [Cyclobacterium lianum]
MASISSFEDLHVWQEARELCKYIRELTKIIPFKDDYRFCSQINAASGSVMDNIAEGFERDGNREFINFLYIAKGSNGEVRSQSYRAFDAGFITEEELDLLLLKTHNLKIKLSNLIITLKNSGGKGYKKR